MISESDRLRPNLFLIGSMKCGTTSLHNYLGAHPQVFMTQEPWKEPAYFVDRLNWSKGEAWYRQLFDEAGDATYRGESSTDYTKFPHYEGVAQRIARFAPDARILYLVRDPVERSISHYWWEVQWSAEGRDILTAIRSRSIIRDVSHYALQLRQFIPYFGLDRILVLSTEELSAAPEETLARIYRWLGLDDTFVPPNLHERHNVSPKNVPKVIGSEVLSHAQGTVLWKAAKRVIPATVRQQAIRALSRPVPRDERGLKEAIKYLRPMQREQTAELAEMLGRQFPEWTMLHGSADAE
jgi:Sulfotransferase family